MVQIIWEFKVKPEFTKEFEKLYGKEGDWVRLFKTDRAYKKTELIIKDLENQVYITIDTWKTVEQYEAFLKANSRAYKQIENLNKNVLISKEEIGIFSEE